MRTTSVPRLPLLLLLALIWPGGAGGVRITELDVPAVALEGDDVHLRCDYEDEGGSSLYTLKWYKDDQEFFRHQPGRAPREGDDHCRDHHLYHVDGVTVDCWVSTERDVVLQSVTKATSGDYQCEVIGEHPKFRKETRRARLTIFSEDLRAPLLLGAEESYSLMDYVTLNCSSLNTEYMPELTWLINNRPANQSMVREVDSRTAGLVFQVRPEHFQRGEINVACVTSLGPRHKMSTPVQLPNRDGPSVKGYFFNTGHRMEASGALFILATLSQLRTLASPAL
ncbi:hypothetical protein O3P69_006356 [Scylla paramamosain]|uniref:Ig-like domain-containing protein n=1 Tax=Scylla paramamosain TaxID=85552 RepID=A0AAW0U3G3_SCYPA